MREPILEVVMVVVMMAFLLNDELSDSRLRRVARLRRVGLIRHHYDFLHSLVVMMSSSFLDNYSAGLGRVVGRWVRLRGISWLSHDDFLYARMMMMPTFFNYDGSGRRRVRLSVTWLGIRLRRVGLRRIALLRISRLWIARLNILLRRVWLWWVRLRSTRHSEIHVNFSCRSASIMQRNPLLKEASLEHMEVEMPLCDEFISSTTVPVIHQKANTLFPVPH